MNKRTDDLVDVEEHLILRLPEAPATRVRQLLSKDESGLRDKLQVKISPDYRHAEVKLEDKELNGTLVDLPCILESQKTLDRKNFYKVSDVSQMLVCKEKEEDDRDLSKVEEKRYQWNKGLTPPLKNVRRKRFRKTLRKKYLDAPDIEKELKRLLRADLEAVSVTHELIEQEPSPKKTQTPASSMSMTTPDKLEPLASLNADDLFGSSASESNSEDDDDERPLDIDEATIKLE